MPRSNGRPQAPIANLSGRRDRDPRAGDLDGIGALPPASSRRDAPRRIDRRRPLARGGRSASAIPPLTLRTPPFVSRRRPSPPVLRARRMSAPRRQGRREPPPPGDLPSKEARGPQRVRQRSGRLAALCPVAAGSEQGEEERGSSSVLRALQSSRRRRVRPTTQPFTSAASTPPDGSGSNDQIS